jgi:general secretion pathway protein A
MNYLSSLQCKTEPFSSPVGTGVFVYQAARDSIEKISNYIFRGSGLQLIIGAPGSGKTTLLKQLAQKFSADNRAVVLLLNNPQFRDLKQFLVTVAGMFKTIKAPVGFDDDTFQKAFNSFFYKLCQQEKRTVLLLIDNGQNLPEFCLRALSSFYDHHPDCKRFLQTVISGEPSFQQKINSDTALNSRVASVTAPQPFRFKDIRKLIRFHLERAAADPDTPPALFSIPAQWGIYRLTQGHPKKIIDLCHYIILTLIIEKRKKADWFMALRSGKVLIPGRAKKLQIIRTTSLTSIMVLLLVFGIWSKLAGTFFLSEQGHLLQMTAPQKVQPLETQPGKSAKTTQETPQPQPTHETVSKTTAFTKENPPPVIPAEEQDAEAVPAEKSAVVPDQPDDQAGTAKVPGPEAAAFADEEVTVQNKPLPEAEIIVAPATGETREVVKPGDILPGNMQQVYGPDQVKKQDMDQVIAANPHLRDSQDLEAGPQVFSPVIEHGEAKSPAAARPLQSQPGTEPVPAPQPPVTQNLREKPVKPPEYLGDIITAPGENFGDMVRRIYGPWSFNPENVKMVMALNPELKNPELLKVGDKIRFPAIPVALTPKAEEVWWVRITTRDTIQSAYRFLRKYRKSSPPLLIIPSRDTSGQVSMNILLEEHFVDKSSAQKAIRTLPAPIGAQAESLHGLNPATFYYGVKQED